MRTQIKKGQRFEVFKRDCFTCQYCGRKPPQIVLHVDHILAVSKGGENTFDNFITSCADCNIGKGNKPLERIKAPMNFSVEEKAEKLEQIKQYQEHLQKEAETIESFTYSITRFWAIKSGQKPNAKRFIITCELDDAVKLFLRKLIPQEIMDAIEITFSRHPALKVEYPSQKTYRFKFFCGVCWKKIRDKEEKPCM